MIHNNAFYLFIINTGIVLATAYFLDLWATYTEKTLKTERKCKTDKK
jgi:hypothetical protein